MKGRVYVESVVDEGSTFFMELFLPEGKMPVNEISESAMGESTLKVLLVEDHDLNRELLLEMLRIAGCDALGVGGGVEALALLQANQFELVLVDLHMPGMDGAHLTREWRKIEAEHGRIPVRIIGISADARIQEQKRCASAGMDAFLGKPFSIKALKEMLTS